MERSYSLDSFNRIRILTRIIEIGLFIYLLVSFTNTNYIWKSLLCAVVITLILETRCRIYEDSLVIKKMFENILDSICSHNDESMTNLYQQCKLSFTSYVLLDEFMSGIYRLNPNHYTKITLCKNTDGNESNMSHILNINLVCDNEEVFQKYYIDIDEGNTISNIKLIKE